MLKSLYIRNVALISETSIEFTRGLNVLSGETGAGKSIIIDSLAFALGERADKSLIKSGEESAFVEAVCPPARAVGPACRPPARSACSACGRSFFAACPFPLCGAPCLAAAGASPSGAHIALGS